MFKDKKMSKSKIILLQGDPKQSGYKCVEIFNIFAGDQF